MRQEKEKDGETEGGDRRKREMGRQWEETGERDIWGDRGMRQEKERDEETIGMKQKVSQKDAG